MTNATPHATLQTIVDFLNGIGIETREGELPASTFLPGVRVVAGGLVFDRARLTWPGDLLHEAGHIAVVPPEMRPALYDDLQIPPSLPHAAEPEVTAWAFAAVRHLGLEPAVLFHEGGYHGCSPGLLATYCAGVYPGAFGLAQAGMTFIGPGHRSDGMPVYPAMARWLRT